MYDYDYNHSDDHGTYFCWRIAKSAIAALFEKMREENIKTAYVEASPPHPLGKEEYERYSFETSFFIKDANKKNARRKSINNLYEDVCLAWRMSYFHGKDGARMSDYIVVFALRWMKTDPSSDIEERVSGEEIMLRFYFTPSDQPITDNMRRLDGAMIRCDTIHTTKELWDVYIKLRDDYPTFFMPMCWCCDEERYYIHLERKQTYTELLCDTTIVMIIPYHDKIKDEAIRRLEELKPHWKGRLKTTVGLQGSHIVYPRDIVELLK